VCLKRLCEQCNPTETECLILIIENNFKKSTTQGYNYSNNLKVLRVVYIIYYSSARNSRLRSYSYGKGVSCPVLLQDFSRNYPHEAGKWGGGGVK
jgi:hypothetical protein